MAENCLGFYLYKGECGFPESPEILTRIEKGQALTHAEMDFNLASLLHTASFSEKSEVEITPDDPRAVAGKESIQSSKRTEETENLHATLHYAGIVEGEEVLVQNKDISFQIQHTTDEILEKVANERIPGTLDVADNLTTTGSLFVVGDSTIEGSEYVSGSSDIGEDLHVHRNAEVEKSVRIRGDLIVDGVIYGNISSEEYHTPDWNKPIARKGKFIVPPNELVHPDLQSLVEEIKTLRADVDLLRKLVNRE